MSRRKVPYAFLPAGYSTVCTYHISVMVNSMFAIQLIVRKHALQLESLFRANMYVHIANSDQFQRYNQASARYENSS